MNNIVDANLQKFNSKVFWFRYDDSLLNYVHFLTLEQSINSSQNAIFINKLVENRRSSHLSIY